MRGAYYNEIDPYAATWLRNLIADGHIAAGDVDERSITEVKPDDLKSYGQCHFFAGIGGWSLAARLAGIPDDLPIWTGSCPCQPFSSAGKRQGGGDDRHLWPIWFRLICEREPAIVFGEQVAAAIAYGWLDAAFHDLETKGYACAAAVLPACSVGAPHKRDRLWFMANAQGAFVRSESPAGHEWSNGVLDRSMADTASEGPFPPAFRGIHCGEEGSGTRDGEFERCGVLENPALDGRGERRAEQPGEQGGSDAFSASLLGDAENSRFQGCQSAGESSCPDGDGDARAGSSRTGGGELEWLFCPDGKSRPVKPGIRLLANGISGRVGALKGYGNAIVPQVAAEFMSASFEALI